MDVHHAVKDLFFADALDLISVAEVHDYRVARGGHAEGKALDFQEGGLQAVPLRLVLFAAFGFGEGVGEDGVVLVVWLVGLLRGEMVRGPYFPEGELLERGPACEELRLLVLVYCTDWGIVTSKMLPTMIFCSELSWTPAAVLILVLSIPRSFVGPFPVCWLWLCI
jgi:hypothetical protein